jgi:hypothetical protein
MNATSLLNLSPIQVKTLPITIHAAFQMSRSW